MKVRNYTPHTITLVIGDDRIEIPPCGTIVRASQTTNVIGELELNGVSVPIVKMEYAEPIDVPEYEEGTMNIVSSLALSAIRQYMPERNDFVIPSESVRDEEGKIIGCKSLGM